MKYLGSKYIVTDRLELKPQTMEEQKYLWELLMLPDVNRYFLTVPTKFREKLKNWDKQKEFYEQDIKHANDKDIFRWSIFIKGTNNCIGRISCHEGKDEDDTIDNPNIRGVGWIIDPKYQGLGYGTEAAIAMINYMFNECEIDEIRTGAAICNPSSWKIMEKLGFVRLNKTKMVQYTFLDELTEDYAYLLTRDMFLEFNKEKEASALRKKIN
jgi:RimJ/RimL family protein N-acetyltransferase